MEAYVMMLPLPARKTICVDEWVTDLIYSDESRIVVKKIIILPLLARNTRCVDKLVINFIYKWVTNHIYG